MAEPRGVWDQGRESPPKVDRVSIAPARDPNKLRWGRGILVGLSLILLLVILGGVAVYVITDTNWGRERVRRYAETMVSGMVHGKATIGRLTGNLLTGMTVHNLTITDSAGAPFASVESFSADYSIMSLWRKRIWVENAVAVRPKIILDKPPVGAWNWQSLFPRDTTPKAPSQQTKWGDWLRFTNATVIGGQLIVRSPWHPSENLTPRARDSVVGVALVGGGRLMITRAGTGFQKTVRLDSVNAKIPLLRLSEPGRKDRLLEVSSLSMKAYPFRPPAAVVRNLTGIFPFNNDSVWWKGAKATMPQSTAQGDGSYVFNSGDLTMSLHSELASFNDTRWIYPRLPVEGHGKVDLKLTWRGAVQDYQTSNVDIMFGAAHVLGAFGITQADTITIHNTDLRFTGLETRTLEQLIPHFSSPRTGRLAGHVVASGGRHALLLNSDVVFSDQRAGVSHVLAVGEVGFLDRGGVRARNLRLQLRPVQVAMARSWDPTLPIGGEVTGTATVNGSTTSQLEIVADLDHTDRGTHSAFDGTALIRLTGGRWFDVNVNTKPVSLVEIGRFVPAAGLQGSATGPVHLVGALNNLNVQADLLLPDGGRFTTQGTVDLASKDKGYDLTASLYTVNLRTINSKAPITSLTAHTSIKGRGVDLATLQATVAADFSTSK